MKTRIKVNSKSKFGRVHLMMIQVVIAYAMKSTNVAITDLIVAFKQLILQLSDKATAIVNLQKLAKSNITGFAAQRNALRTLITEMSVGMMGAARNYSINTNNKVLLNKMVTNRSDLNAMSLDNFMAAIGDAIDIITPLTAQLRDYGVDAAGIAVWTDNLNSMKIMNADPTLAITNRKKINTQIQQYMKECMTLLYNQCDTLVLQLKTAHPDYVTGWFYNRKLRPTGIVTTKLRAVVQNELDEPIANAMVMVDDENADTNSKGECSIDVTFGSHQVTVVNGANSKTFGPYVFKKGQSQTIHFTIASAFVTAEIAKKSVAAK